MKSWNSLSYDIYKSFVRLHHSLNIPNTKPQIKMSNLYSKFTLDENQILDSLLNSKYGE